MNILNTKVKLTNIVCAYPDVFVPGIPDDEKISPKFALLIAIPKTDQKTWDRIETAQKNAETISKKHPSSIVPLKIHDAEEEYKIANFKGGDEEKKAWLTKFPLEGSRYFSARSNPDIPPHIMDITGKRLFPIIDGVSRLYDHETDYNESNRSLKGTISLPDSFPSGFYMGCIISTVIEFMVPRSVTIKNMGCILHSVMKTGEGTFLGVDPSAEYGQEMDNGYSSPAMDSGEKYDDTPDDEIPF